MAGQLTGQVAIVTGAGRGFGRAIADRFAAEGASIVISQRSQAELKEAAREITAATGARVIPVAGDVSEPADVQRIVDTATRELGPIDVMVSNAGVHGPFGPVWEVDPEDWWRTQESHLRGAFLFAHAVMGGMVARKRGRIITVASLAGRSARVNMSAYGVAKAAQIRLVEWAANEGREHGVYCWSIQPGTVITGMAESTMANEGARRWVPGFTDRLTDLKANADPASGLEKCADLCMALASGRCDALSGKFLEPDWDLDALVREAQAACAQQQ